MNSNTVETVMIGPPAEKSDPVAPVVLALAFWLIGAGLAVAGVYLVFGLGWALLAGSVPMFTMSALMFRGLTHA